MRKIALTGGIACGKSRVGSFLEQLGMAVCDADQLAHEQTAPGQPAYHAIVDAFGPGVLGEDGALDRRRLGAIVFADERARARLNALVHPGVRAAWEAWLQALPTTTPMGVVMVPLLFEAGMASGWDAVICVRASEASQRSRLADRGLTPEAVTQRIQAQWPIARKAAAADYVIDNDGSMVELEARTQDVVRRILESTYGRANW